MRQEASAVKGSRLHRILCLVLLAFLGVVFFKEIVPAAYMYLDKTSVTIPVVGGTETVRVYGAQSARCDLSDASIADILMANYQDGYFPLIITAKKEGKATLTVYYSGDGQSLTATIPLTVGNGGSAAPVVPVVTIKPTPTPKPVTPAKQKITGVKITGTKPFRVKKSTAKLSFKLAKTQKKVKIQVLNSSGKVVWTKTLTVVRAGKKTTVSWKGKRTNGKNVPKGFYRFRITAGKTRKYSGWMQWK